MDNFILKQDLLIKIKAAELDILLEDSVSPLEDLGNSIAAAEFEMKSYISHRHDVAVVMPPIWYFNPLERRGDSDLVFLFTESMFDSDASYGLNELVSFNGSVYRSEEGENQGNPPDETSEWVLMGENGSFFVSLSDENDEDLQEQGDWKAVSDPRNPLLKRLLVDLVLYDLHARIKPRQIPDHRVQLRDDSIKLLRDSADPRKNITLDLPLKDHGEKSGVDMTYGGNKKIGHSY